MHTRNVVIFALESLSTERYGREWVNNLREGAQRPTLFADMYIKQRGTWVTSITRETVRFYTIA